MDHHEYRNIWMAPIAGQVLQYLDGARQYVDKFAVTLMNKDRVVEHLMKEKLESLRKTVFFFLTANVTSLAKLAINGKAVNKGTGMGMDVQCTITFTGTKTMLNKLKTVL